MKFKDIAEFALGHIEPDAQTLKMASLLLIDTLGVAAGAANMHAGVIARNHAARFMTSTQKRDSAHMLFDGREVSITGAAFAMATQIDNLDAHDGYNPTKGHIGCAVVPALCALGEQIPDLTGRDALIALIVAYEIAARAGIALHATVDDYHTSGAWNALGVAALASRLRRHDLETFRHALGIAEYHGPRSQMMREIANPTMLHDGSGMGAMVGAMAAFLAEDGFQGAPAITVEQASEYWSDLGANFTINQNYIKPYPICRWAHAAIDALGSILDQHDLDNQDIAHIEVRTFSQAAALFQGMPDTSSQAQYSLPFALAVRLLHGEIAPDHIQGPALGDPQIKSILAKINVSEVEKHARRFPAGRWSDVTVTLKSGDVLHSGDIHARGGPEAPMDMSEIERKFETMTSRMDAPRRHQIWQMTDKLLDENTPFSELLTLLHPPIEEQHA